MVLIWILVFSSKIQINVLFKDKNSANLNFKNSLNLDFKNGVNFDFDFLTEINVFFKDKNEKWC